MIISRWLKFRYPRKNPYFKVFAKNPKLKIAALFMKIILRFLSIILLGFGCHSLNAATNRPNVILILVDDMGWSNIGCYGGMVETPNIDRLARDGVRFDQFYNAARCCPTRATLMTGLHPHQVGIGHMTLPMSNKAVAAPGESRGYASLIEAERENIPPAYQGWLHSYIPTLPEMLRDAGYGTYHVGKWHLASEKKETWPMQRGYDRFYGHLAGTSDYFDPPNLYRGNNPIQASGERFYLTDAISEQAIGFLDDHHKERSNEPFFLYLAYNAPHFPLQSMPEEYEKYRGRFMEGWDVLREKRLIKQKAMGLVPANTVLAPRPDDVPAWDSLTPGKQNEMDAIMSTYAGMVDRVDQNIGKLVKHLQTTGELDNTLIFFLSDNGAEAETGPLGQFKYEDLGQYGKGGNKYGKAWATMSNTPFREYKHYAHQGGVQTPLIVHWPNGIAEGPKNRILPQYGYLPDIVETIMDVAGAKRPTMKNGKSVPQGEGISIVGTLNGSAEPIHTDPIFIEHEGNRIARVGKWKLVSYFDQPWELYNLDLDRSESNNLVADRVNIATRLEAAYHDWAERAGVIPWETAKDYSVYVARRKKEEKGK
jgi:arylsulfatase A-like enzyme